MDAQPQAAPEGLAALTPRQAEIYSHYRASLRADGKVPTMRAVADALGFKSLNGLMCHLKAMERKGVIARSPRSSRGVRLLVEEPIRAGRDPAGEGLFVLDCGDRVYRLDRDGAAALGRRLLELAQGPPAPQEPPLAA